MRERNYSVSFDIVRRTMLRPATVAKNKGTYGKAKSTVEETDEFVDGVSRVAQHLKPYTKQIVAGLIIVVVVAMAWSGYQIHLHSKEEGATALYSEAVRLSQLPLFETPREPPPGAPKVERAMSFTNAQERSDAVLAKMDEMKSSYGGTDAYKEARAFHAAAYLRAQRYEEAAGLYREILATPDLPWWIAEQAREGLAYALEGKGLEAKDPAAREAGLKEALAVFDTMPEDGRGQAFASYHRGRLLAQLGRRDEAKKAYEAALEGEPPEVVRTLVEERLELLKSATRAPSPPPTEQGSDDGAGDQAPTDAAPGDGAGGAGAGDAPPAN